MAELPPLWPPSETDFPHTISGGHAFIINNNKPGGDGECGRVRHETVAMAEGGVLGRIFEVRMRVQCGVDASAVRCGCECSADVSAARMRVQCACECRSRQTHGCIDF